MNTLKLTFSLIFVGITFENIAQTTKSEPIFGSVVERKVSKDSTKKKTSFNVLKPAFLRIGVMGGGLIGFENASTERGGSSGIKIEYGISNRWSLVGEVSGNRFGGITFSRGQASLGFNWMPFKSRRLQPYFGLSGGVGGDGFRGGRGGRYGRGYDGWFDNDDENNRYSQGFATVRTGLNYVLFKKIVASAETGYQVTFNTSSSSGGLSLKVGVAYQFTK
ncbi:MAG: hypothetical protein RLZZ306_2614 [Bacteroidota bacterium]|jgi:hypothetical protein